MSETFNPFSPTVSQGLKPVCLLMSISKDNLPIAEATKFSQVSFDGGGILCSSGV
jgi:hypothetical protein